MTDWFEQWFGAEYLRLYPHRDDEDAGAAVALVNRVIPLAGLDVLDLACGPGRHTVHLRTQRARVVGLDLSLPLLSLARSRGGGGGAFVRGDMRHLPFRKETFDVIVNLFTSFGYFAEDAQHGAVLRDVARLLRHGGTCVLDYFNAAAVRAQLVPRDEQVVGTQRVVIERHITSDGRYVVKEMHLMHDGRSFLERVRLFTPEELERLLREAGLLVRHRFGDYDGSSPAESAPRVILAAVRP